MLRLPSGDGPFPVVVTVHGGRGNRDPAFIRTLAVPGGISPTVTMLNEQPWAILAISYRAGGGAVLGMEQDDVVAGIRFAKTLPRVDPARVGVLGGSHGGHLALRAAEVMGREIVCVAAGSPWMTNPRVCLFGKPDQPPLSEITAQARAVVLSTRATILPGLQRNRGLSAEALDTLLAERSIEEHAAQIVVPALFLTSLADEQVPHVMVEPTIARLKAAGRDVTVYTAMKSLHGFCWGRDVGGARVGRGAKTSEELAEEAAARDQILRFFAPSGIALPLDISRVIRSTPYSCRGAAAQASKAIFQRFLGSSNLIESARKEFGSKLPPAHCSMASCSGWWMSRMARRNPAYPWVPPTSSRMLSIDDTELTVVIVKIGHRRDVYP